MDGVCGHGRRAVHHGVVFGRHGCRSARRGLHPSQPQHGTRQLTLSCSAFSGAIKVGAIGGEVWKMKRTFKRGMIQSLSSPRCSTPSSPTSWSCDGPDGTWSTATPLRTRSRSSPTRWRAQPSFSSIIWWPSSPWNPWRFGVRRLVAVHLRHGQRRCAAASGRSERRYKTPALALTGLLMAAQFIPLTTRDCRTRLWIHPHGLHRLNLTVVVLREPVQTEWSTLPFTIVPGPRFTAPWRDRSCGLDGQKGIISVVRSDFLGLAWYAYLVDSCSAMARDRLISALPWQR